MKQLAEAVVYMHDKGTLYMYMYIYFTKLYLHCRYGTQGP